MKMTILNLECLKFLMYNILILSLFKIVWKEVIDLEYSLCKIFNIVVNYVMIVSEKNLLQQMYRFLRHSEITITSIGYRNSINTNYFFFSKSDNASLSKSPLFQVLIDSDESNEEVRWRLFGQFKARVAVFVSDHTVVQPRLIACY